MTHTPAILSITTGSPGLSLFAWLYTSTHTPPQDAKCRTCSNPFSSHYYMRVGGARKPPAGPMR